MSAEAEHLIRAARHLAARGLSPGSSGNLSVRVGSRVLITPTGSSLSRVEETELAEVSAADGSVLRGKPSKEYPLHLAVYRQRPEAAAVVHLHSPHATAVSCLPPDELGRAALPPLTPYRVMRLGEVPVAPYARPGSAELAAGVEQLAARAPVLLLAQHGSVVAADGIDAAADLAEELETAAQVTLLLQGLPATRIPPDQLSALLSSKTPLPRPAADSLARTASTPSPGAPGSPNSGDSELPGSVGAPAREPTEPGSSAG